MLTVNEINKHRIVWVWVGVFLQLQTLIGLKTSRHCKLFALKIHLIWERFTIDNKIKSNLAYFGLSDSSILKSGTF